MPQHYIWFLNEVVESDRFATREDFRTGFNSGLVDRAPICEVSRAVFVIGAKTAKKPKAVIGHKELVAMKRSLAACDKLGRTFWNHHGGSLTY